MIDFGQEHSISELIIGLDRELEEEENITLKLLFDNESKSQEIELPKGERVHRIYPEHEGVQNMMLELTFNSPASVVLPIKIIYTTHA